MLMKIIAIEGGGFQDSKAASNMPVKKYSIMRTLMSKKLKV